MSEIKDKASSHEEETVGYVQTKGTHSVGTSEAEKKSNGMKQNTGDLLAAYDHIDTNKLLRKVSTLLLSFLALNWLIQ